MGREPQEELYPQGRISTEVEQDSTFQNLKLGNRGLLGSKSGPEEGILD
jgi:hypothetical protein